MVCLCVPGRQPSQVLSACPHNQYFALHTTAPLRVLLPCSRFHRLIFPAGLDHFPREIRHDGFDTESEKMFLTLTVVDRPDTDFIFVMVDPFLFFPYSVI